MVHHQCALGYRRIGESGLCFTSVCVLGLIEVHGSTVPIRMYVEADVEAQWQTQRKT